MGGAGHSIDTPLSTPPLYHPWYGIAMTETATPASATARRVRLVIATDHGTGHVLVHVLAAKTTTRRFATEDTAREFVLAASAAGTERGLTMIIDDTRS
jgi:hypothetical protein